MKGLIVFLALPCLISCWKPISPSFTLSQTFPEFGAGSESIKATNDVLGDGSSVDRLLTTYNGNEFIGHEHVSDSAEYGVGFNHGRIFNGKSLNFGQKFLHNGLYHHEDSCAVDKFALEHEGTIKYDQHIQKLDQFTLCTWMRFTKHDGDHVLFTYSVDDEPREIQLWVANANNSSFISLAIHGQSLFRLNYPLIMKKWHHACTSWNGKTGEWQLWVKAERVGRGFHNRLVGHKVDGGGKAFTGGKSITGPIAQGLHYEVTLLQLYKVALSAGKAHRDHKHHHVHHFDFNGPIETPMTTAAPPTVPNQPINPLLANGQIPSRVRINLAGTQQPEQTGVPSQIAGGSVPKIPATTQFVSGQFHTGGRNLQTQLLQTGTILQQLQPQRPVFLQQQQQQQPIIIQQGFPSNAVQFPEAPSAGGAPFTSFSSGFGSSPANVQFIDDTVLNSRFKRDSKAATEEDKKVLKRDLVMLGDGSIVDDKFFDTDWYDGLGQFGDKDIKKSLTRRDQLEEEIREHDREPAEGEVEAVKAYCSTCFIEPFQTAVVLAWKDAHTHSQHALRAKGNTVCGDF